MSSQLQTLTDAALRVENGEAAILFGEFTSVGDRGAEVVGL